MSVDRLVSNLKTDDRAIIIESMHKLIKMISQSPRSQEEIIKYLPGKDILKIMRSLEDIDSYLRKLTVKFFLELVYGNYVVQQVFCDILGIIPCDGKVCLNKMPEGFRTNIRVLPECLEIVKKTHPEENREQLPFAWAFSSAHLQVGEKKIDFITCDDRFQLDVEQLPDPAECMIGFIMRNPRKFHDGRFEFEKTSYKQERVQKATSPNPKPRNINTTNTSIDQSSYQRTVTENKSPQRSSMNKYYSPMRGSIGKSPIFSSRYNYTNRNNQTKAPSKNSTQQVSQSMCKTERQINQLDANRSVGFEQDELAYKSIDAELELESSMNRPLENKPQTADMSHRGGGIRQQQFTDFSVEYYDNSKLMGSINESQEFNNTNPKVLIDHSLNSSINNRGIKEKSPNVTCGDIKFTVNKPHSSQSHKNKDSKRSTITSDIAKKISEKVASSGRVTSAKVSKGHDEKSLGKNEDAQNSSRPQSASNNTPKGTASSILSKFLKEKNYVRESIYASKKNSSYLSQTQKLNSTLTTQVSPNTSMSQPKHKINSSINHGVMANSKNEQEHINKKNAFHQSLLKSMDATDKVSIKLHTEDPSTSYRESLDKENINAIRHHEGVTKTKTYNFAGTSVKSPSGTPRQSELKSNLNSSTAANKILNSRKSHDISYLSKHKQKKSNEIGQYNQVHVSTTIASKGKHPDYRAK